MINGDRQRVLDQIKHKLENDLNNVCMPDGYSVDSNIWYSQQYQPDGYYASAPNESVGWPPELVSYIKRVAYMISIEILNSIYTEQEMEEKVEGILLNDDNT